MKKILIVVLLVFLCVNIIDVEAIAKIKFGNWDKWDEELPPVTHEAWSCEVRQKLIRPYIFNLQNFNTLYGKGAICSVSSMSFYSPTDRKVACVVFYSPGSIMKKTKDLLIPDVIIENAELALVAFPPENNKMIIRAYKKEGQVFRFFEEWEIVFENYEEKYKNVASDTKFRQIFKEWVKKQITTRIIISEEYMENIMINFMLPKLVIYDKKSEIYIISVPATGEK